MSTKKAAKNIIFNWISLLVTSVLSFVGRTFLIRYLGNEVLGVNATIVETVNLLSISELGIQTSIIYKMYKPILENNKVRQQELFNVYRVAYRFVAGFIVLVGIILLPFLDRLVNSNIETWIVYSAYLLQIGVVAINYALSYYKILFLVNQRQYIVTRYEILVGVMVSVLQIISLVVLKNYLIYLAISYLSAFIVYIVTFKMANRDYRDIIQKCKIKKTDVNSLFSDMKEMFVGTISGYMYGSTDNLLISYFFGSIMTGFVSNYKMVTKIVRTIISSASASVSPTWGEYLNKENAQEQVENSYQQFIFIEYCVCLVLLIPTWLLLDDFIIIWLGKDFLISKAIVAFIVFDIFINNLNEPACVIIRNLGMFKEEKIVSTIAAFTNLSLSILLAIFIGVEGIFIGTICAVGVFWVMRSYYVNKRCFGEIKHSYVKFWKNNIIYVGTFCLMKIVGEKLITKVYFANEIFCFLAKGIILELFIVAIIFLMWGRTKRFEGITDKVKALVNKG